MGARAFPTERARDITPDTVPAIVSQRAGAYAFRLTDIERLGDGSVAFTIGVPQQGTQEPPAPYDGDLAGPDGFVLREDPVTGRTVRFLSQRRSEPVDATPRAGSARRR